MERLARGIVRYRQIIFFIFLGLAVVCAFCALQVHVNSDMTKYLPASMQMKQGQDIMNEEFGESSIIELMVKGPQTTDDRQKFADDLAEFDQIASVTYEKDDSRYNNGEYTRYTLTADGGTYSSEVKSAVNVAEKACEGRGYEYWVDANYLGSPTNSRFALLMVFAVCIAMAILFILAASWIEPLVILFVILIAVLINLGTNLIMGEVSDTTNTIGAILQMVLSMDYIIMLLNRYRNEKATGLEPAAAMERAVAKGMSAIASSSLTTVAGLLCLVFMSFTIGRDLGVVLAKGVFLSLICAFALMPALILWLDRYWLDATRKPSPHPQMKALSALAYHLRYGFVVVFVVLLAIGLGFKNMSGVSFVIPSENPSRTVIAEQFTQESQVVVLYPASEQSKSAELTETLSHYEGVTNSSSYASTLGKPYTAAEMANETDMDVALLRVLYYKKYASDQIPSMTGQQLADYVRDGLAADLGDALGDDFTDKLESFATLIESKLDADQTYTADEAAEGLSDIQSIKSGMVTLIYLAHAANVNYDDSWTLSTDGLMTFISENVLTDSAFDQLITGSERTQITEAADTVREAKDRLINDQYGRIILTVGYESYSDEMDVLCTQLRSELDGQLSQYWLVGEGPMVQEMAATFTDEFNFLSIITVLAIFLIVLITFRNLLIPALLVALIQTAFNYDLLINAAIGSDIYYVALLVVQSILMGATIDYAILFTTSYREAREAHGVRASIAQAYRNSINTICMSGSILVLVCFVLGLTGGGITGQICLVIAEGATASVVLVLLVLPGVLAALDRIVVSRKKSVPARQSD